MTHLLQGHASRRGNGRRSSLGPGSRLDHPRPVLRIEQLVGADLEAIGPAIQPPPARQALGQHAKVAENGEGLLGRGAAEQRHKVVRDGGDPDEDVEDVRGGGRRGVGRVRVRIGGQVEGAELLVELLDSVIVDGAQGRVERGGGQAGAEEVEVGVGGRGLAGFDAGAGVVDVGVEDVVGVAAGFGDGGQVAYAFEEDHPVRGGVAGAYEEDGAAGVFRVGDGWGGFVSFGVVA